MYYKNLTCANFSAKKVKFFELFNEMSKKRIINGLVAMAIFAALSMNAACNTNGWPLVGEIFGWSLIVAILFIVVDHRIKEKENA